MGFASHRTCLKQFLVMNTEIFIENTTPLEEQSSPNDPEFHISEKLQKRYSCSTFECKCSTVTSAR